MDTEERGLRKWDSCVMSTGVPWLSPGAHCPTPGEGPVPNGVIKLHSLWLCPALEADHSGDTMKKKVEQQS